MSKVHLVTDCTRAQFGWQHGGRQCPKSQMHSNPIVDPGGPGESHLSRADLDVGAPWSGDPEFFWGGALFAATTLTYPVNREGILSHSPDWLEVAAAAVRSGPGDTFLPKVPAS